jgi:alkylated DNA repair dioxygenase AlkB
MAKITWAGIKITRKNLDIPFIASISLGAPRKFVFRKKQTREEDSRQAYSIVLGSGSLLIMQSRCQEKWQHCLPKMTQILEPRINLTFRNVFHS